MVTGGAQGIGRATAQLACSRGAAISILDVDPGGAELVEELRAVGGRAEFQKTDVSHEADVREAFAQATHRLGAPDCVVHAAGMMAGQQTLITELTVNDWHKVIEVNLTGCFFVCRAAVSYMLPRSRGVIILVASQGGVTSVSGSLPYGASKAGMHAFAETLAQQVAKSGIRVHDVCPGQIDTALMRDSLAQGIARGSNRDWAQGIERRLGSPEGVGSVIAFACSDEADYLRGTLETR